MSTTRSASRKSKKIKRWTIGERRSNQRGGSGDGVLPPCDRRKVQVER